MCALFGRAEARDFLDVDAAISSGRYTRERLHELASEADPCFDAIVFADAIGSLEQITDMDFDEYRVTDEHIVNMRSPLPIGHEHCVRAGLRA
jgi:hypothetical protein